MHDHPSRGAPARSRRWRLRLAALVAMLTVAACGSGGKPGGVASLGGADQATSTGASSDLTQAALAYGRCMRLHGINMPDPQIDGNRIVQRPPEREAKTPKFGAAWQACRRYAPNGGKPQRPSAEDRQQALAFARCMRQHGINNMPDPQITAKGIRQQLPTDVDRDDPRLSAAEQACAQSGRGGK